MSKPGVSPSVSTAERLRQRRNAERRFELYGQAAIGIAISFLLVLLLSIIIKSSAAFTQHTVSVTLDRPDFADQTEFTVTEVNLAVRDQLLDLFPEADADRSARADLYNITTRLAVLPLRERLLADPAIARAPIRARLALSDDLDLYLKNEIDRHRSAYVGDAGRLSVSDVGLYRLTDAGPDGFVSFQDQVQNSQADAQDILISLGQAWFELERVSGAVLVLSHLAGPLPALGEQAGAPINATYLDSTSENRRVSLRQIAIILHLKDRGEIARHFNTNLFANADSTYPELAGAAAALLGSLFTMLVTALFALPVGVLAAVYLEEFARKSRLTSIIEVNINNLAAVPSIIFGLLGAAVFLNTFGLPRSIPFVGGLVLGLLVLPTIIIASRAALRAVPPSVRDAALGLGASPTQAVFHHVLPLAAPGILTGAIIAMARALGETAPLLLIGMVAFISEVPTSPNDEATVLPVLIYKWFSGAERAWEPMTSAVILILLTVLVAMNLIAVVLRRRFERRW